MLTRIAPATLLKHIYDGATGFAIFTVDLDGVVNKEVNDMLGHQRGDELLRQVARRLRDASRESDFPGRLGGDEFALLQVGQADPSSGGALAAHIVRCLAQPFKIGGFEVEISASIGIATSPVDSDEPGGLLKKADLALYKAKAAGRNRYQHFTDELDRAASCRAYRSSRMPTPWPGP